MADAGTKIMHMHYDWDNERKILQKMQGCQRNYDYEKWKKLQPLLVDDIVNELLWTATNIPTKQHEGYFDVYYTADRKLIQELSRYTWGYTHRRNPPSTCKRT